MAVGDTPPTPIKTRTVAKTTEMLVDSDAVYLEALLETKGDRAKALAIAGHHPGNENSVRKHHWEIMKRIDSVDNLPDLLKSIGMGQSKIILGLKWLYDQENVRFMGTAIKLHAELLGLNTPQQSQGTPIQVNVMNNVANPIDHQTPSFVKVSIDARKPLPQQSEYKKVGNEEDEDIDV